MKIAWKIDLGNNYNANYSPLVHVFPQKQLICLIKHLWHFVMDFDRKKTRLLDISTHSFMRCTEVGEILKISPLSSETWSKKTKEIWNIVDFLVHLKQVNHTNFLVRKKLKVKGLRHKSSSKFYNIKDSEFKASPNAII